MIAIAEYRIPHSEHLPFIPAVSMKDNIGASVSVCRAVHT